MLATNLPFLLTFRRWYLLGFSRFIVTRTSEAEVFKVKDFDVPEAMGISAGI